MALNEAQKQERSEYLEKNLTITECSQRIPYVFISYASNDWEAVFKSAVVPMQRQCGLRVYADKAFDKTNDRWIVPMLRNIRGSDMMVAFVSQSYIESYACFLELLTAVNNKKQIVFVSLEQTLDLGDTTDQPFVERGVKAEILNQGANIATNVNNTSNDLMRAMKSAYTSISTLLEQDALSKYDISDAFINFFRDSAINMKTINDLNAVRRTIGSISENVFDGSLVTEQAPAAETVRQPVPVQAPAAAVRQPVSVQAPAAAVQQPISVQAPAPGSAPAAIPAQSPAPQPAAMPVAAPKQSPAVSFAQPFAPAGASAVPPVRGSAPVGTAAGYQTQPAAWQQPVSGPYGQNVFQPGQPGQPGPGAQAAAAPGKKQANHKLLIGGAVAAVVVLLTAVVLLVFFLSGPKNVTDREYTTPDGFSGLYTGEWKGDGPSGQGIMTLDSGDVFEGEWADGVLNGEGTGTWTSGNTYEGEFKENKRDGQGVFTFANGDVYEGEFKENKREGTGTMTYANGDVWEGTWKDNQWAEGVYDRASDGAHFEGEWIDDHFSMGTYVASNGNIYEGEFDLDAGRLIKGKVTDTEGTVREGEFSPKNSRLIQGRRTTADGDYRDGTWDPETGDFISGTARATQNDGRVYEGEWSNGTANGHGAMTLTDGTVLNGVWQDGQMVEEE